MKVIEREVTKLMSFTVEQRPYATLVTIRGTFDAAIAPDVFFWMIQAIGTGQTRLIVDLAHITRMDIAALAVLLETARRCEARAGYVMIAALNPEAHLSFDRTQLESALTIINPEPMDPRIP